MLFRSESAEERRAAGKPSVGKLIFRANVSKDRLVFELEDDGRGIDWDAVREKAKTLGLPHASHEDLVVALCHDGLSTKDSASQLSGRGVGMAALKIRVLERRGHIDAISSPGRGTTISVSFPLSQHSDVLVDLPVLATPHISMAGNA